MLYTIITATGQVSPANNAAILHGLTVTCGGTAGTITIKDGSGGSTVFTVQGAINSTQEFTFKKPIRFANDIHMTLSNVTCVYVLFDMFKA